MSLLGGGKGGDETTMTATTQGASSDVGTFFGQDTSSSGSDFSQDVWGGQSPLLQDLYGQAGSLYNQQTANLAAQQGDATNYMNQVTESTQQPWEQQLQGGAYSGMDIQGQLNQLMAGGADTSNTGQIYAQMMGGEGNTYADAMKNVYLQDADRAQDMMMKNLDARAAASGMSGGSRHGTATAQGMEDINRGYRDQISKIGYDTFDKDLAQKLDIAKLADANTLSRYQGDQAALQSMLGQQQSAMTGGLDMATQQQDIGMGQFAPGMVGWDQAGAYSDIIGAPTVLGSGSEFGQADSSQTALNEAINNWGSNQEMTQTEGKSGNLLGTVARGVAAYYTGGASEAALAASD